MARGLEGLVLLEEEELLLTEQPPPCKGCLCSKEEETIEERGGP